jgi:hypothetical protein
MAAIQVEASAVIDAPAERAYAVIADYRSAHPQILPRPFFTELTVEEGGYGAGTVIRVTTQMLGVTQRYHMAVTEPEPGRRLVEKDIDTGLTTSFTVAPRGAGQSHVSINTRWEPKPGLAGLVERLTVPPIMRGLYHKELRLLADYLKREQASAAG